MRHGYSMRLAFCTLPGIVSRHRWVITISEQSSMERHWFCLPIRTGLFCQQSKQQMGRRHHQIQPCQMRVRNQIPISCEPGNQNFKRLWLVQGADRGQRPVWQMQKETVFFERTLSMPRMQKHLDPWKTRPWGMLSLVQGRGSKHLIRMCNTIQKSMIK